MLLRRRSKTKERYVGDRLVSVAITELSKEQVEQEKRLAVIEKELGVYRIREIAS